MEPSPDSASSPRAFERRLWSGGLWATSGQLIKLAIELAANVALARLIAPAQFGEVAMVTSLMTLGHLMQDGGLSAATIQAPVLERPQLDTTFWMQLAIGCGLGLTFAAAAPLIARFYGEPQLESLAWALSAVFPVQALAAQPLALLGRELRMDLLLRVELAATLVASGAGVYGALLGWGPWALVARSLLRPVALVAALALLGRLRVGTGFSPREAAGLLRFGKDISLYNLVNYLARNLDDVLIGRFYGGGALGLYQRAYQFATAPVTQVNTPLGKLATPALSRLADRPLQYRETYLGFLAVTLGCTMPLGGSMAAAAEPLIRVVLGERWLAAAPLFTALSLLLFTQPIGHSTGWLFVSQGRSGDMLRWGVTGSTLSVLSFLVGLPFGPLAVAWCYALGSLFVRLPWLLWFVGKSGPVRAGDVLRVATPAFAVGLATFLVSRGLIQLTAPAGPLVQCLAAVCCALLGMLACAVLTPAGRRHLGRALGAARSRRGAQA